MKKLNELAIGDRGIMKYCTDARISSKLISMGVYPEAMIEVVQKTFRKHALYLRTGSLNLALLNEEADTILVEELEK